LQAKVIPDSDGNIGIYSADPSLYGNITYGSSADQATVQRARVNSPKNNLLFGLPRPIVKDTAGNTVGSSRFVLQGNTLQVVASGLSSTKTPVTIDPSVVVTSASDFGNGNSEDNIDFSTSGQITRGGLTGGTVGSWATTSSFTQPSFGLDTAVYNGYMYLLSGHISSGSYTSTVQYAPINASTGTVGAWHYTHNSTDDGTTFVSGFSGARSNFGMAIYNGYLYIAGGGGSGTVLGDVQYASLNANGTVGSWAATTSMNTTRGSFGFGAYNGYLYAYGGCTSSSLGTCSGYSKTLEYAPINANGTIGTWTTSGNNMTTTRINMEGAVYNGYLYAMGGCVSISLGNCTSQLSSVEYAPINSDGTVGTWALTTSFTTSRQNFATVAYNGYLYIMGGSTSLNDVQYAPIYANGALGSWSATTTFTTARFGLAATASNGYLYLAGGCSSTASNCGSSLMNDVQYAKIDPAGVTGPYATNASTLSTSGGQWSAATVAYGGYMYILGGINTQSVNATVSTVYYAKINGNGSLGSWSLTTAFNGARSGLAAAAYNGYMYITGGTHTTSDTSCSPTASLYCTDVQKAAINSDGTLGAWASAGSNYSAIGRANLGAVAYDGHLYVMGGDYGNNSSVSAETDVGQIQSDGTVTGWTTTGNLVNQTSEFAIAQEGPYVYILGGRIGSGSLYNNNVEYAILSNSGTVSWASANNFFANARGNLSGGASNGYVYITGGAYSTGNSLYSDTQYARICMDASTTDGCNGTIGTLGTWHTTSSFTTGRLNQMGTIYNGYLYVMGGCSNQGLFGNCASTSNVLKDVQYTLLNNGGPGTAGSWATNSTSLGTAIASGGTVAYNGYLYVLGGSSSGTPVNTVQYAPINANGTLGTWQTTTSLGTARAGFSTVAYNGYLYILGGFDSTSTAFSDVQYAPINANGTIGAWQATTSFATPRAYFGATVYDGYLYILGGYDSTPTVFSDVQYAPINANGTLGTWQTTTSLGTARAGFSTVAYDGYLYILGGFDSTSTAFSDVQYAPINANGTIGAWQATTSFATPRAYFGVVTYDGYLYLLGGYTGTNQLSDVQYAPINANGTIGAWQATTSLGTARAYYDAVAYRGYLYIAGGIDDNGNTLADVQYTPLNVQARIGHYSKLVDLGSAVSVTGVTFNGTAGGVSISYRAAGTNGVFGSATPVSSIASSGCTSNVASTRYLLLMVTLDDSYGQGTSGGFPDDIGTPANLTDLTVNYSTGHPPPNIRLRGGQTLQAGVLSPLDTCS
jgi:hypothetical protein